MFRSEEKWRPLVVAAALVVVMAGPAWAQSSDEAERIASAITVFEEMIGAPDKAIPRNILENAEAIAVFPDTLRGGFIVGAQRGRGIVSVRNRAPWHPPMQPRDGNPWSAPAFMTITGGSFGAQIGGQATDLVLVFIKRGGIESLMKNSFKIGADAAAAGGPVGRDAQAATDIQLRAAILSYSRSRGLFAGVTVNGAAVRADRDANERFYGKPFETREIVLDWKSGAPEPVGEWRGVLAKVVP